MASSNLYSKSEEGVQWLINSGCSNHMSRDRRQFKNLKNTPQHNIRLGDGNLLQVVGVGIMVLQANSRKNPHTNQCVVCAQIGVQFIKCWPTYECRI